MPEELSEEVECDELELALSEKGNKNLNRKPRQRGTDFKRNQGKEIVIPKMKQNCRYKSFLFSVFFVKNYFRNLCYAKIFLP